MNFIRVKRHNWNKDSCGNGKLNRKSYINYENGFAMRVSLVKNKISELKDNLAKDKK